jgi:hypothetical protein
MERFDARHMDKWTFGPQSQFERWGENRTLSPLSGTKPRCVATILTEMPRPLDMLTPKNKQQTHIPVQTDIRIISRYQFATFLPWTPALRAEFHYNTRTETMKCLIFTENSIDIPADQFAFL